IRDFHVTGVQTCALPIWLLVFLDLRVHDLSEACLARFPLRFLRGHIDDALGLILVVYADESECEAGALNHRLVPKHALRMRLPGLGVPLALAEVLRYGDWVRAVLAVDGAGAGLVILLELHPVKL